MTVSLINTGNRQCDAEERPGEDKGEFHRQAKGCLELPTVQREEGGGVLPHTLGESSPARTLISEPLEL